MLLSLILVASISCGTANDGGGVGGSGISMSFKVPANTGGLNAMSNHPSLTLTDGAGNTLLIESAEVVLREIEFERVEAALECDDPLADESDCEEFKTEPVLVSLPLDGSVSIRVKGTFNDQPFEYTTDLNAKQELVLAPPLEIVEGVSTNVTLSVDVSTWFKVNGVLVNPETANDGQPNKGLVEDNIKASIEGFEDEDKDGEEDP